VAFLGTDNRYAIGRARQELGYEPRIDLLEGVRRAATWYRDHVAAVPLTGLIPRSAEEVGV
jgi:nucleoside-diphosphate-sugar epimerase